MGSFTKNPFPKTAKWSDWIYFHDVTKIHTFFSFPAIHPSIIDTSIHPLPLRLRGGSELVHDFEAVGDAIHLVLLQRGILGTFGCFRFRAWGLASGYHSGVGRGPKKSIAGFIYCRCILGDTSIYWVCFFRNSEPQNEMTNQGF